MRDSKFLFFSLFSAMIIILSSCDSQSDKVEKESVHYYNKVMPSKFTVNIPLSLQNTLSSESAKINTRNVQESEGYQLIKMFVSLRRLEFGLIAFLMVIADDLIADLSPSPDINPGKSILITEELIKRYMEVTPCDIDVSDFPVGQQSKIFPPFIYDIEKNNPPYDYKFEMQEADSDSNKLFIYWSADKKRVKIIFSSFSSSNVLVVTYNDQTLTSKMGSKRNFGNENLSMLFALKENQESLSDDLFIYSIIYDNSSGIAKIKGYADDFGGFIETDFSYPIGHLLWSEEFDYKGMLVYSKYIADFDPTQSQNIGSESGRYGDVYSTYDRVAKEDLESQNDFPEIFQ